MKGKKIIQFGHSTLRQVAAPLSSKEFSSSYVTDLADNLRSSLPENGVGLAGPQIDVSRRIFIADIHRATWSDESAGLVVCVNPEVISSNNDINYDWEGCLSAPGIWGQVPRPTEIKVRYLNEFSEIQEQLLQGVGARVFQHELDHLDGVLFVDRMDDMETLIMDEEFNKLVDARTK